MVSKPQVPSNQSSQGESTQGKSGTTASDTSAGEVEITVGLGQRSYPIRIGAGLLNAASVQQFLPDMTHSLVIHDAAVGDDWVKPLVRKLDQPNRRTDVLAVASGETSKSIQTLARVWDWMLESGGDRRSVVIAIGGGVIGDLAGFAAASFTRGIRFIQVPTTLLAMVDSSVGGKTGINLDGAKNMVGAFWQPQGVLVDTDTLRTLPDRSYLSGLGEVVKYGVIDDAEFFDWLENNAGALVKRDPNALRHAIQRSCESKARVVEEDERETSGRRAILNYGHTFAHAIEATAGYGKILHGEAVAIGMQMAARLAQRIGMVGEDLLVRQTALLKACQLPVAFTDASVDEMLPVMMRDKKVAHGKLRFILPTKIGHVDLIGDVGEADVVEAIRCTTQAGLNRE